MSKREIWKDIKSLNGLYQVSNLGRVRSKDRYTSHKPRRIVKGMILKPRIDMRYAGFIYPSINNKRTSLKIHRLVAEYFLDNPDNLPLINHKDGDKLNNVVSNLEWMSYSDMVKTRQRAAKIRKLILNEELNESNDQIP